MPCLFTPLCRTPRGPTLTMRIHEYALIRDVVAAQQRPRLPPAMWLGPPLVVMNNFGNEEQMKLAAVTFQNLFPAINVQNTRLSACQVRADCACLPPQRQPAGLDALDGSRGRQQRQRRHAGLALPWTASIWLTALRTLPPLCSACCCLTTARRRGASACGTSQSQLHPLASGEHPSGWCSLGAACWTAAQGCQVHAVDRLLPPPAFRQYLLPLPPPPPPFCCLPACSKNLKHLLARKDLPDMGRMADVAEFLTRSGYGSVRSGAGWGCWRRKAGSAPGCMRALMLVGCS